MPGPHTLFTWTSQRQASPFELQGGEGAWFWDSAGRRWLDMASVVFNANAGHNHPRILDAMRRQLWSVAVAGPFMQPEIRESAARALAGVTPAGLDRFLFTLGGADANEHAVKMAMLVTGRRKVVCRTRSYHGATFGALSFSDDPRSGPFLPGLPGIVRVKGPYCFRCPWETTPELCDRPCASHVEQVIAAEGGETIAAVLMETVPGTTGGYLPPLDYYGRVRRICDRYGILLILDEVLTGFGRTGRWFASEHYSVAPDMMTMGKGITSGHAPLGAVAVNERVAAHFEQAELLTGLTHTAHPVSLAALSGNLQAFEEGNLLERSRVLGAQMAERLLLAKAQHGVVADVRSLGLYGCLELREGADAARLRSAAFERGVHLIARGTCLFVAPPLVILEKDLDRGMDVIDEVLASR